jgi:hypothetical protein
MKVLYCTARLSGKSFPKGVCSIFLRVDKSINELHNSGPFFQLNYFTKSMYYLLLIVPDRRIGLVNVVFVCKNKCLSLGGERGGVMENARATRQLALSKGPEEMGHLPP